ncbi:MAG: hypothetical protein JRJ02_14590 [Deltaproteobacteria bacterium]|nr:hypothetical protein [Deltaproteobacteria bacterium]
MNLLFSIKRAFLLLTLLLSIIVGSVQAQDKSDLEKWKNWIGKEVNISYACCGMDSCKLIRNAKLLNVTDKAITIIIKGSQHLIPNHMITVMVPAK